MSEEVVVIQVFHSEMEAELVRGQLELAGVKAFVLKDDAGGMVPSMQLIQGVRLMVAREDEQSAREILDLMETTEEDEFNDSEPV